MKALLETELVVHALIQRLESALDAEIQRRVCQAVLEFEIDIVLRKLI